MKPRSVFFFAFLLTAALAAQTPGRSAFRLKAIEAIQDIDAIRDVTSTPVEDAINRVQARRSVQELGRIAASAKERNVAAAVAQYLMDERTCIYGQQTSSYDESKKCFDGAFDARDGALKLAGIDPATVYPK